MPQTRQRLHLAGLQARRVAFQSRSYDQCLVFMDEKWSLPLSKVLPCCLLYTSDAADELDGVDLGGRRIIKKKFFQAEDGILDVAPSRGLGDVYKRQHIYL